MIKIYEDVIYDIKPTEEERNKVLDFSDKLINIIMQKAEEENIDIKCRLVGSMAKKTSLMNNSDMDIFITFPLSYSEEQLEEYGMMLGRHCINKIGAREEIRYASHPYITGITGKCEIDFVPCYQIKDAGELKSAVDRTILHTDYIQANLTDDESTQVLLLKKFMTCVNTYGANSKINGFSGYLCELLMLRYHTFEEVINAAANVWHNRYYIDLEDYQTAKNYNTPLIVIDPTDKNRNVSAALSVQKFSEFIIACRNYQKNPSRDYFNERKINTSKKYIHDMFRKRNTAVYVLEFDVPDLPSDSIYPQVDKTMRSFERVSGMYDFRIIQTNFYITGDMTAKIVLEYESGRLSDVKIHNGPLVTYKEDSENFKRKYPQAYIHEDKWMAIINRKYRTVHEMITNILVKERISILKLGKNIKKEIGNSYRLYSLEDFLETASQEDLEELYMHLHPTYKLER